MLFSDFSKTPLTREEHKKLVRIIHNLLNMNESVSFRKPVCYRALGLEDYKDVVKKPMDLNMIRRNNNEWTYKLVQDVLDDIQLCWDNCRNYNRPGSEIYECAVKMEENFLEEIRKQYPTFQIKDEIIRGRERVDHSAISRVESQVPTIDKPIPTKVKRDQQQVVHQDPAIVNRDVQPVYEDMDQEVVEIKKPIKKDIKVTKFVQKVAEYQQNIQQQEPQDVQIQGQQQKSEEVQPILVTLPECPPLSSILLLSERIKAIRNQRDILRGVLRILHEDQKQDVIQSDQIHSKFDASAMKMGTYIRINKFLNVATKM